MFDTSLGMQEFEVNENGVPLRETKNVKIADGKWKAVRIRKGTRPKIAERLFARPCLEILQEDHPKVWEEVEGLMARGEASDAIVEHIHARGVLKDIKHDTIRHALARQKRRDFQARVDKAKGTADPGRAARKIDILAEVETLVATQKARYEAVLKKEDNQRDAGMLMEMVSKEGDRLLGYTKDLANLYFDLGIMARAPKVMKGMIAQGTDPVSGQRIVQFALKEEEIASLEGIVDVFGKYLVPASA